MKRNTKTSQTSRSKKRFKYQYDGENNTYQIFDTKFEQVVIHKSTKKYAVLTSASMNKNPPFGEFEIPRFLRIDNTDKKFS